MESWRGAPQPVIFSVNTEVGAFLVDGVMKYCNHCQAHVPDGTYRCPHCRGLHPQRGWVFQAFLVAVVAATAAAAVLLS